MSSTFPCFYIQSSPLALSHSQAPDVTSLAPSPAGQPLAAQHRALAGKTCHRGKTLHSSSPGGTFQPPRTHGCCRDNPDPAGCRCSLWSKAITCFHKGPTEEGEEFPAIQHGFQSTYLQGESSPPYSALCHPLGLPAAVGMEQAGITRHSVTFKAGM